MSITVKVPTEWTLNGAYDLHLINKLQEAGILVTRYRDQWRFAGSGKLTSQIVGKETVFVLTPAEPVVIEPVPEPEAETAKAEEVPDAV